MIGRGGSGIVCLAIGCRILDELASERLIMPVAGALHLMQPCSDLVFEVRRRPAKAGCVGRGSSCGL